MWKKTPLKEYIKESVLIKYSDDFYIRLSKELEKKYQNKNFDLALNSINKALKEITSLNIKYPSNANPVFYFYIVPFNKYNKLLKIPKDLDDGNGGGQPRTCYDLDGFKTALTYSENILEKEEITTSRHLNDIHEIAHLVIDNFCFKNRFIHEGFADLIPYYILDHEKEFKEYIDVLTNLEEKDILTTEEILILEQSNSFDKEWIGPKINCSFVKTYISSYLFTRICIDQIIKEKNVSKNEAVNIYLNILKNSEEYGTYLIYDIAYELNLDKDKLYKSKEYQLNLIKEIKKLYNKENN